MKNESKIRLTAEDRKNIKRIKQGWTLHCWRMTTPHNYWIQGKRDNSMEEISRSDCRDLIEWFAQNYLPLQCFNSVDDVPEYNIGFGRGRDCGLSRHTFWTL